jgi:hypothetical protein
MGFDISDADFTIAAQLYPPNPAFDLLTGHNEVDMSLDWKRPAADLLHGPVSNYRVMSASSPQGPWSEVASPSEENTTLPLGGNPGEILYYKIIATNPAGDAAP